MILLASWIAAKSSEWFASIAQMLWMTFIWIGFIQSFWFFQWFLYEHKTKIDKMNEMALDVNLYANCGFYKIFYWINRVRGLWRAACPLIIPVWMEIHGCCSVRTFVPYRAKNFRSSTFDCIGCNGIHQNSVWSLGMASCRSFFKNS